MQESNPKFDTITNPHDDEIDLRLFLNILIKGKWIIIFATAFFSIVGVIYSLLLPNIYEAKATLVAVNSSNNISGSLGAYSGLAGLAGISLPSGGNESNSVKAMQKITSLSFFENNIKTNIFLPDLMAVKSWDPKTNQVIYDENIYNINTNTWVREYSYPQQQIPSAQESFKAFKSKHLSLDEDALSSFITLSIKHQSPIIAKQWVDLIVSEVNNFYRQKDKLESKKSVNFLNLQISSTGLSEIKEVLAKLLQEEIQKLTLIESNDYYVFEYIDPPAVMEKKSEPNRALICILFGLLGGVIGIIVVSLRQSVFKRDMI